MKNITVSLDDASYRRARIVAAKRDTSVSGLFRQFVESLSDEDEFQRLARLEKEIRSQITDFSASDNVSRDELYERHS